MTPEKHLKKIIDRQFKIAGHDLTYEDVTGNKIPEWYQKFTCTPKQNKQWLKWLAKYLKTNLHYSKDKVTVECAYINLMWGLKEKE